MPTVVNKEDKEALSKAVGDAIDSMFDILSPVNPVLVLIDFLPLTLNNTTHDFNHVISEKTSVLWQEEQGTVAYLLEASFEQM